MNSLIYHTTLAKHLSYTTSFDVDRKPYLPEHPVYVFHNPYMETNSLMCHTTLANHSSHTFINTHLLLVDCTASDLYSGLNKLPYENSFVGLVVFLDTI